MSLETATVDASLTDTPVVETPETPEPAVSIADHASQFSPDRKDADEPPEIPKTPANTGQFATKPADARHRASTQRATPEDVAEINALTKELRDLEAKAADKDPHAKDAPRVKTLKRQIAALKSVMEPPAVETKPDVPRGTPAKEPTPTGAEFSEKEPVFEDFSADQTKYPDPLKSWMQAVARYEARKDRWEEARQTAQQRNDETRQRILEAATVRLNDFAAKTPDFDAAVAPLAQRNIGPILVRAIEVDDNGPAFVYHLAKHPDLLDELVFLSQGKELNDDTVAFMQRRLTKELTQGAAVSTGSAPPPRPYQPPRPPNPVRSGPIKTADDPPAEASSISEHRKHFGQK